MATIGDEVLDGFKQANSWLKKGNEWLDDLSEFYRERAAIEREAATKLATLTSKHFTKKAALSAVVSVGESPDTTPGSLENGSLQAWMEVLTQTEAMATQRKKLADDLTTHVSEGLSSVKLRFEELRGRYKAFDTAIGEQRDEYYNQVKKSKLAYDSACEHMEQARSKGKKVESREADMHNAKTAYILAINVANRIKDKYYHDDIPELLDSIQLANESKVAHLNRLLKLAADIEKKRMTKEIAALDSALQVIAKNDPSVDTQMFIQHNRHQFNDPTDFYFQASPIWHDNDELYTKTDASLRYLRAKLGDAETETDASTQSSQQHHQTYEKARDSLKTTVSQNGVYAEQSIGHTMPILRTQLAALEKLVDSETSRIKAEVEIETIEAGTAAVDMSAIPVTRTTKHRTLLGKTREVVEVVDTNSPRSKKRPLGLKSLLARTANLSIGGGDDDGRAKAFSLYEFTASEPGELSVPSGVSMPVVDPDDGSGWVKVRYNGNEGIVPASYLEITQQVAAAAKQPPPPPPSRGNGAPSKTMIALYDYDAADPSQLSIRANDRITVIAEDSGDGWTEGSIGGSSGIFPTSYARQA